MRKEKAKLLKDYGDPVTMKEFRRDLNAFEKAVREDERRRMSEEQNGNN